MELLIANSKRYFLEGKQTTGIALENEVVKNTMF